MGELSIRSRPRLSVRAMQALVAACGVLAWLAKGWLFPNRLPVQRFALIGPIDMDRDGRDDRAWLTWVIIRNGGRIDFDLPVTGPVKWDSPENHRGNPIARPGQRPERKHPEFRPGPGKGRKFRGHGAQL